jgi:predicted helicase
VVAHLKVGLVLKSLGATLQENERAGIYLTNALTGWEPATSKPLPFPDLEEERKKADEVKQKAPILVILGNPPYNGFAGMAQELPEERSLSLAYRTTKRVRAPEGQGLNDLYVRFFRRAERRIVDKTGRGIVSFISNYSWLDGLSHPGMRERYLEAFDVIRIDCLNGDAGKTGKTTPEGLPDPSIFSTEHNREGIAVGTAIATLIRKGEHSPISTVAFRHLWGTAKRAELLASAESDSAALYETIAPSLELGLPFIRTEVSENYYEWPKLTELLPTSFPGVQSKRDSVVVDIDEDRLRKRMERYFDSRIPNELLRVELPEAFIKTKQYDPQKTRGALCKRGMLSNRIVRYLYRPFDVRWIYWEHEHGLLSRRSPDLFDSVFDGNAFIEAREKQTGEHFSRGTYASTLADNFGNGFSSFFPLYLKEHVANGKDIRRQNLSQSLEVYIKSLGLPPETIFKHILSLLHSPSYRLENAGALRMDWPRVPIPANAKQLGASSDIGLKLANLLDPNAPVDGVTRGKLRVGIRMLGLPQKKGAKPLEDFDLALSAGWGHVQTSGTGSTLVMPGLGSLNERDYTLSERGLLEQEGRAIGLSNDIVFALLGNRTLDVHLNADVMWANWPAPGSEDTELGVLMGPEVSHGEAKVYTGVQA